VCAEIVLIKKREAELEKRGAEQFQILPKLD